ncbi:hypothetical protein DSO57_1039030 [Entomophthora muscae]|uniref:Uncharacterized protein n=2 Tax=Entomophthora muscae TaxID=34485 RepID=A0ACC2TKR6_9FUNG|nr:hypothetical protein DSO57_1012246 [Entomophthora muscae]KAJ9075138.1 hypothetical protein DSO57_1039030 [Entomophthora muscae]
MLLSRNISILIFSGDDDFISNPASLLKIHAELARNLSPNQQAYPNRAILTPDNKTPLYLEHGFAKLKLAAVLRAGHLVIQIYYILLLYPRPSWISQKPPSCWLRTGSPRIPFNSFVSCYPFTMSHIIYKHH